MSRAFVIAHRGASGYLPEHTLAAKALAYGLGADFLEQDVIATRDRQLIVLHDVYLDDVTDVAHRFPRRSRADGRHYAIDFDLDELLQLTVSERRRPGGTAAAYPQRFPVGTGGLRIATLDQELQLVQGLNRSMSRNVGIYPEIKDPQWHREQGVDLARLLLDKLGAYGYRTATDRVFVQCFEARELQRVRDELGCKLKLVQLVEPEPAYAELLTGAGLERVARYAQGLSPSYTQLLDVRSIGGKQTWRRTELAAKARAAGLQLHPYTFRRDKLPPYAANLEELLTFFFREVEVDAVFSDHPDIAVRVRDAVRPE